MYDESNDVTSLSKATCDPNRVSSNTNPGCCSARSVRMLSFTDTISSNAFRTIVGRRIRSYHCLENGGMWGRECKQALERGRAEKRKRHMLKDSNNDTTRLTAPPTKLGATRRSETYIGLFFCRVSISRHSIMKPREPCTECHEPQTASHMSCQHQEEARMANGAWWVDV